MFCVIRFNHLEFSYVDCRDNQSLQNVEVSKTNNRNDLIDMQRKINYNKQAIVKYAIVLTYED